jgi:tetratricopeptide (TPR) repeat protein
MIKLILVLSLFITLLNSAFSEEKIPSLKEAYMKLDAGDAIAARNLFEKIQSFDKNLAGDAEEGIAWSYIREGDFKNAVIHAKARLQFYGGVDQGWMAKYLEIIRLVPELRKSALEEFRTLLKKEPKNLYARKIFAETLSWSSETYNESVEQYNYLAKQYHQKEKATPNLPADQLFDYANSLLKSGENKLAIKKFSRLLEIAPSDKVCIGFAQAYFNLGRLEVAGGILSTCSWIYPKSQEINKTLAVFARDIPLIETFSEGSRSEVSFLTQIASDSSGLRRRALITTFKMRASKNIFIKPMIQANYLDDSTGNVLRQRAGVEFKVRPISSLLANLRPGVSKSPEHRTKAEGEGRLVWSNKSFPLNIGIGARSYHVVDGPIRFSENEYFYILTSGLKVSDSKTQELRATEFYGSIDASYDRFYGYYSPASVGISDGNSTHRTSMGMGMMILPWMRFKLDYFSTRFKTETTTYFSPKSFAYLTPGIQLEFHPSSSLVLLLGAGRGVSQTSTGVDRNTYLVDLRWTASYHSNFFLRVEQSQQTKYIANQTLLGLNYSF